MQKTYPEMELGVDSFCQLDKQSVKKSRVVQSYRRAMTTRGYTGLHPPLSRLRVQDDAEEEHFTEGGSVIWCPGKP